MYGLPHRLESWRISLSDRHLHGQELTHGASRAIPRDRRARSPPDRGARSPAAGQGRGPDPRPGARAEPRRVDVPQRPVPGRARSSPPAWATRRRGPSPRSGRACRASRSATRSAPSRASRLNQYGLYGDLANAPVHAVAHHPASLSWDEAAAVWMQYLTAYGALIDIAGLTKGDAVVIPAASSSVGLAAIQIANKVGAVPIALTRTSRRGPGDRWRGARHRHRRAGFCRGGHAAHRRARVPDVVFDPGVTSE